MNIRELIEKLSEIEEWYGDIEVRAAFQPNYPLVTDIQELTTVIEDDEPTLFIALGDGEDYGTKRMWDGDVVTLGEDDDE